VQDADAKLALTSAAFKRIIVAKYGLTTAQQDGVKWIATDGMTSETNSGTCHPKKTLLFLQDSSGSSGTPMGIVISHTALKHNLHTLLSVAVSDDEQKNVAVSWKPQYRKFAI